MKEPIERLAEFAQVLGRCVEVRGLRGQYWLSIRGIETKESKGGPCLTSPCGRGESANNAASDYIGRLRGRLIVLNAYSNKDRQEFPFIEC